MADFNAEFLDIFSNIENQNNSNDINKIRKTTILKYSAGLSSLDNRNSCMLLDDNLKNTVDRKCIKAEDINKNIGQRKFGLKDNYGESVISDILCSGKPICEKSENVEEKEFQDFLLLFNEKRNKSPAVEQKQRSYAKGFIPQICNIKGKTNRGNAKVSDTTEEYNKCQTENKLSSFKSARDEMILQKKQIAGTSGQKRKLGARRGVGNKFISPMLSNESNDDCSPKSQEWAEQMEDDRLKNIEPRMIELIKSEIMDKGTPIEWNDIAGLEFAKSAIQEAVVWPMLRPDIFTGLRRPPKGILLFGPPGTGKTLIGKCVASQSKSTFFSISASSLTSKWVGDGEKMVRALFSVARCHQPAVIFIDEIDSLLSQRTDTEHESSRRIKTEFLVQLDGATTDNDEKLLVIGATNRPQELDEAARRRFVKRLYIPLPELTARHQLVQRLMLNERHELNEVNIGEIAELSEGYSGADMRNLCADASMGPVRSIDMNLIHSIQTAEVRPTNMEDFRIAFLRVKSSVSPADLDQYVTWNKTYGSGSI